MAEKSDEVRKYMEEIYNTMTIISEFTIKTTKKPLYQMILK